MLGLQRGAKMSGKSWVNPLIKFDSETRTWEISGSDAANRGGALTLLIDESAIATTALNGVTGPGSDHDNYQFHFVLGDQFPEGSVRQINVRREDGSLLLSKPLTATFSHSVPPPKVDIREFEGSAIVDVTCANSSRPISYDLFCDGQKIATYVSPVSRRPATPQRFRIPAHLRTGSSRLFTLVPHSSRYRPRVAEVRCAVAKAPLETNVSEPRAYIVDPALREFRGHMFSVAKRLETALAHAGSQVEVIGGKQFKNGHEFRSFRGHFNSSPYEAADETNIIGGPPNARLEFKLDLARRLAKELAELDPLLGSTADVIFPTLTPVMTLAVAMWAAERNPKPEQRLVLNFMLEPGAVPLIGKRYVETANGILTRSAFEIFSHLDSSSYLLVCASEQQKRAYDWLARLYEVKVEKWPNFFVDTFSDAIPPEKDAYVLLYAGEAKNDKGFENLPELLTRILKTPRLKNVKFALHYVGDEVPEAQADVARLTDQMLNEGFSLAVHRSFLDGESYAKLLRNSSLIVVAYDPEHYFEKSSGVTWEAIVYGRPIIATSGSFMGREAEEAGLPVSLASEFNGGAVFDALCSALNDRESSTGAALKASQTYCKENGAGAFAQRLVGLRNPIAGGQSVFPSVENLATSIPSMTFDHSPSTSRPDGYFSIISSNSFVEAAPIDYQSELEQLESLAQNSARQWSSLFHNFIPALKESLESVRFGQGTILEVSNGFEKYGEFLQALVPNMSLRLLYDAAGGHDVPAGIYDGVTHADFGSSESLLHAIQNWTEFDVVIENGNHSESEIRRLFDIGFSRLRPGGFYISLCNWVDRDAGFADLIDDVSLRSEHRGGWWQEVNYSFDYAKVPDWASFRQQSVRSVKVYRGLCVIQKV